MKNAIPHKFTHCDSCIDNSRVYRNTREESKERLQNDGKWRAQHPDYYLIKVNCPLCNKVVSKRTLTRHQRSENCKKLQPKEYI